MKMNKILLTIRILAALTRPTVLDTCLEMIGDGINKHSHSASTVRRGVVKSDWLFQRSVNGKKRQKPITLKLCRVQYIVLVCMLYTYCYGFIQGGDLLNEQKTY